MPAFAVHFDATLCLDAAPLASPPSASPRADPYWDRAAREPHRATHDAHSNFRLFLAQPVDAAPREFSFPEQSALKMLRSATLDAAKVDRLLYKPAEELLEKMRRGTAPNNDDIYPPQPP